MKMTMKKKALLSSILTIALCLSIIAGSTFALFTDSTSFNIAVTSGDIEISATAEVNALYSAKGHSTADDKFLVDEFGHTYTHDLRTDGKFYNGGTAAVNQQTGTLEIVNITPGDRVDVDIVVDNTSNVAFVYRYKIVANDTNLATGMVLTVDGESFEAVKSWTSEWYPVVNPGSAVATKTISLELPVYAGNEYQTEVAEGKTESVEYTITVEAVQGNAVTDNESEVVLYPTQSSIQTAVENGAVINLEGATFETAEGFLLGEQAVTFVNGTITATAPSEGVLANGTTGMAPASNTSLTLSENTTLVAPGAPETFGVIYNTGDEHTLTINAGSKIVAEGTDSACVLVVLTTCHIYVESFDALTYDNGARAILNMSGEVIIHVVDDAAKTYFEELITVGGFITNIGGSVSVVVG